MDLKNALIGEIVAQDFRTAAIFKKNGIDFCCKGERTIEDACKNKSLNEQKIYTEIEDLPKSNDNATDFNSWQPDLLADYVEKTHHRYVREKAPIIQAFLGKLCKVHGERHQELFDIKELFDASVHDLASHMKKEEFALFPFIKSMMKAKIDGSVIPKQPFETVENPVNMMKHEHAIEGERLRKIAELTNEYNPPADVCNTYKATFSMLQDFENDLHKHIHLENNILFPKAIILQKEFTLKD